MGLWCWLGSCLFLCFCWKGIWIICCVVLLFSLFFSYMAVVMLRLSLLSEQQQILRKWSANKWLSHKSVKFRVFAYSFISHAIDAFPSEGEKPLLQLDFCKPLKWRHTEHRPWLRFVLLMGWICAAPTTSHPLCSLPFSGHPWHSSAL